MLASLVVLAYREITADAVRHCRQQRMDLRWGVTVHARLERGVTRFGFVTLSGESGVLSNALAAQLAECEIWLDGAVPLRFAFEPGAEPEGRRAGHPRRIGLAPIPGRGQSLEDAVLEARFREPAECPALCLVLRDRPRGWPR